MTQVNLNNKIRNQKAQCSMLLMCVDECGYYNVWFKDAVELPESKFIEKFGAKDGHFWAIKGQKRFKKIAENYPDWETDF